MGIIVSRRNTPATVRGTSTGDDDRSPVAVVQTEEKRID
jgi:hypothetical protein